MATFPSLLARNRPAKLIFAGVALGGLLLLSACGKSPDPRNLPVEDLPYASQLELSDPHLSAEENFLGQQVVYLDGKIMNHGSKVVEQVSVRLFFHDTLNRVVLREDQNLMPNRSEALGPGQTRSFQIRFDRIPDSWDRQLPQLQFLSLRDR